MTEKTEKNIYKVKKTHALKDISIRMIKIY